MNKFQQFVILTIVVGLGLKFIPDFAIPILIVALIGWTAEAFPKWNKERKAEKAKQKQLDADAPLRDEFWRKHRDIREKYDPRHEWNEATSLPPEYTEEMAALNSEYRAVMDRWSNQ